MPKEAKDKVNDKEMVQQLAIINSMTPQERQSPDIINPSRKRRISMGSGTDVADLNRLLKQHDQMQKVMKKFKKGNIANLLRGLKGQMGGHRPPF